MLPQIDDHFWNTSAEILNHEDFTWLIRPCCNAKAAPWDSAQAHCWLGLVWYRWGFGGFCNADGMEGNVWWGRNPFISMDRFTGNLFFWASKPWSACQHFLLVALDSLWMMYTVLLRTWHLLALLVYKAESHVICKGHIPTGETCLCCSRSYSEHYGPRPHMDFMGGGWQRGGKGFWGSRCWETPWRESSDGQRSLWRLSGVLSWRTWWSYVAFGKLLDLEKFWKRRQELSLPEVVLSHVGSRFWDGSQVFGLKSPANVTVHMQFATT